MRNSLMIGTLMASLACSTLAYADIFMHHHAETCADLAGEWTGTGKVSNWLIGDCYYHGTGKVQGVDAAGKFTLDLEVNKDSGSSVCPNQTTQHLPGTCSNGTVTLNSGYGDLVGNISERAGSAKGTLRILPGVTADVTIQIKKVG